MKDTEKILQDAGETLEYAKQYMQDQKEYLRLEIAERVSIAVSKIVTALILLFLGLFIFILMTITIALLLGKLLGGPGLGFLCVTAFYILLTCFIYVYKNTIIVNPIVTGILKSFLK